MKNTPKKLLLCILDGWGYRNATEYNAISHAHTPTWDNILDNIPYSLLNASGNDVGLPQNQIGNSEVGHMTIGSGRLILQNLVRINQAIETNSLQNHNLITNLIKSHTNKQKQNYSHNKNSNIAENNSTSDNNIHILGLLSDGGVHSHQEHIEHITKIIADKVIQHKQESEDESINGTKIYLHLFLDGRDTPPQNCIASIKQLEEKIIAQYKSIVEIATISGRYYSMDRDNRWDRTKLTYNAITQAMGEEFTNSITKIQEEYNNNITDEFIKPLVYHNYQGMNNGDSIIMCNFRADRIRQILSALVTENFTEFIREKNISFNKQITFCSCSQTLDNQLEILFPTETIFNSMTEVISNANLKQLHIAETEKYAHVTFFLNGGKEQIFSGESRILVPSPKIATYDKKPEMNCKEVTNHIIKAITNQSHDVIICNYANPDMVGHTGDWQASIKAVEAIDKCLALLKNSCLENNFDFIITADHGNVEEMYDEKTQQKHTAHTTNPVPFVLIGNQYNKENTKIENGGLEDVAPTVLSLLNLNIPSEMTGKNLVSTK